MPLKSRFFGGFHLTMALALLLAPSMVLRVAWGSNSSPALSRTGPIRIIKNSGGHVYMTNLKPKVFLEPSEKTIAVPAVYQADRKSAAEGTRTSAKPRGPVLSPREEVVEPIIQEASRRTGLSSNLLRAIVKAESDFDPATVSSKGAKGLMQLMDITAGEMMVENVFDPLQNVLGGAGYFKKLLERYGGIVELALAAYNAGPTNVDRHKGIPPFNETRNYIRKVKKFWRDYRRQ